MNTFLRAAAPVAALLVLGGTAFAQRPKLPPAPDCRQIAASHSTFWEGRFSGTYEDLFDRNWPIAARACFETEYACRRWVHEIQTIVVNPGLMSCRPASRR
jgi:hypothetical protein